MVKENEVLNDLLGYEGIKIIQRPDVFNFSLDSTLLANFVTINQKFTHVVDLCTGNAPVPLFLSLRNQRIKITGVELQPLSYDLGKRTIAYNQLEERIHLVNDNLKGIHQKIGEHAFDLVTCNPPFFKVDKQSNLNANEYLTIARHEVMATLEDIVKEASLLLKNGGYFGLVHRPDRLVEILETLRKYKLEPKRLRLVYPKVGKEANTILIEARKSKEGGLRILPPLYIHNEDNSYTTEIQTMFCLGK